MLPNKPEFFATGFSVSSHGNVATIWHVFKENNIQAVIQGLNPSTLLPTIKSAIENVRSQFPAMQLAFHYICPQCIAQAIKSQSQTPPKFSELPKEVAKSTIDLNNEDIVIICKEKHRLLRTQVEYGYTITKTEFHSFVKLHQLRDKHKGKRIQDVPREDFIENADIIRLISSRWYTFAERFEETRLLSKEEQFNKLVDKDRPVAILDTLLHSTYPPSFDELIAELEKVLSL